MRPMSRAIPAMARRMHSLELTAPGTISNSLFIHVPNSLIARLQCQRISPRATYNIIALSGLMCAGLTALTKQETLCEPLSMAMAAMVCTAKTLSTLLFYLTYLRRIKVEATVAMVMDVVDRSKMKWINLWIK